MIWTAVLVGAVGCYLLKLGGMALPQRVLDDARVARVAALLPVALLAALIATETFAQGARLAVDARAAAVAVAVICVVLRAPFLVVVGAGAATAALVRLLG